MSKDSRSPLATAWLFALLHDSLGMLVYACRHHGDELMEWDVTVQTCWDADRLDLARVGIWPDPDRLCTDVARQS